MKWFGHAECKDDTDWIKCCTVMEVDGIRQRRHPRKTWWDVVREERIRTVLRGCTRLEQMEKDSEGANGYLANSSLRRKWHLKVKTVCEHVVYRYSR